MFLTTWEPFEALQPFDRAFEHFFPEAGRKWSPAADIWEDEEKIVMSLDVPGMTQKDISIEVNSGVLTVRGERKWTREEKEKKDGGRFHHREAFYGAFERAFYLPDTVEAEKIDAGYANGVLTLTLPKAERAKPRQISVKVH